MKEKPVSESTFNSLEDRVKKIEYLLDPPGGGPSIFDRITKIENDLDEHLGSYQLFMQEVITREEWREVIRELRTELAELKGAKTQIQLPSQE